MFKKIALGLLGLLVVYLLLVWSEWLPRTSPEQQADVDLMLQPPQRAVGQHDAFPLLWSLGHDVPQADVAGLLAADREAYSVLQAQGKGIDFRSSAEGKYPKLQLPQTRLCPRGQASCLEFVRAHAEDTRALVTEYAGLRARGEKLRDSDHALYPFEPSLVSPLPPLNSIGRLQVTATALQFVDGQADAALDAACSDLASWRRLRSRTDMLVLDMVGIAFANEHISLIAAMLAELPADHPLPSSCSEALAPSQVEEFDQCDVWRGEFRYMAGAMATMDAGQIAAVDGSSSGLDGRLAALFFNARAMRDRSAVVFAGLCRGQDSAEPQEVGLIDRVFDPAGAVVWSIGQPAYADYSSRAKDFSALLQALRIVVWLRGQADASSSFAQRPADLQTPGHALRLDAASQQLLLPLLKPRSENPPEWSLPLAASRLPTAAATAAPAAPTTVQ